MSRLSGESTTLKGRWSTVLGDSGEAKTPAKTALVGRQQLSGRSGDRFWGRICGQARPAGTPIYKERPRSPPLDTLRAREGVDGSRASSSYPTEAARRGAARVPLVAARLCARSRAGRRSRFDPRFRVAARGLGGRSRPPRRHRGAHSDTRPQPQRIRTIRGANPFRSPDGSSVQRSVRITPDGR